ncbi:MAG: alpha/beta fold hydrolase [bacterium]|nr:alpha/beta fold hydrolase [bacterium]
MHLFIQYASIFALGFVLISLFSFWLVTHPPQITFGQMPAMFDLEAEDVEIKAPDGTRLAGWFIPTTREDAQSGKALVLLHGYPAEKSDMLDIASALAPHYALLLMDLRSFGESEGRTTLGIREQGDLIATIDFLENRGFDSVGIFGFSLGGAVALLTAAEDERLRAIGAYAPFSDLRSLGHDTYRHLWLLKYPLVELMHLWGRLSLGAWFMEHAPLDAVRELSAPVLLIHSKEDEQISFAHAERLRDALRNKPHAQFLFFERGLHGALPADFVETLLSFFGENL